MTSDLESRLLALLRYALDNPHDTFRRADGMAWLGEASELATAMAPPTPAQARGKLDREIDAIIAQALPTDL